MFLEVMYGKGTGGVISGFVVSFGLAVVITFIIYFIRNLLTLRFDSEIKANASNKSLNDLLNSLPDSVLLLSEKSF
jgi:hypothetical protein